MNLHTIAGSRDTSEFKAFGAAIEAKCNGITAFTAAMGPAPTDQTQRANGPAAAPGVSQYF